MALLTAFELAKSYGPTDIFSHISLSIPHRARIGMVGPNGVGKTTLLRILIGLEEPSGGDIQRARGIKLGYLPQETVFNRKGLCGRNASVPWVTCWNAKKSCAVWNT